ncbi:MAG: arylsulfatase [Cyclobacteriaceae bacterium]
MQLKLSKNSGSFHSSIRCFLGVWVLFSLFVLIGCSATETATAPPNILLIITDDQGWGDVGFHQNDTIRTPRLDALADESLVLERFYVSPVCAPTRASLLTGRYHLATGASWVTHRKEVMRQSEVTIAELLGDNGYRTGLFGKWHNGKQYPHDPVGQGFDHFLGFTEGHFNNYFDSKLLRNHEEVDFEGYMPDVLTDSAIAFLSSDDPFFCYVSYNTPHGPFQVPDKYFDPYKSLGLDDKTACIYGMVENIDDNVGRLLDALEQSGKAENTVVIFMTDNGPNSWRYNGGFKGRKAHVDDGGVRVPFTIRYPEKGWNTGKRIAEMSAHIDLFPTLAGIAGLEIPADLELHGRDLIATFEGSDQPDRYFFTHQIRRELDTIPGAVRNNQHGLILYPERKELYDLMADPYQKEDLMDSLPDVAQDLESRYRNWYTSMTSAGMEPELAEIGHPAIPFVDLPAQEVIARENVGFHGGFGWANDYLIDWSDSSRVTWRVKCVEKAQYRFEISADFQVNQMSIVQFQINENQLSIPVGVTQEKELIPSPDRVNRGEVYEYEWPVIKAKTFTFEPGEYDLSIEIQGIEHFELKNIRLIKE